MTVFENFNSSTSQLISNSFAVIQLSKHVAGTTK